ncbi:hypothetical protein QLQ12_14145 [Actinoplanes sp. NEAU-A12]|uniref:PPE family domain-containing protein n=1 Tax=Actinoplanes sandaracinus TaxID=3045177 RepID=A0ABT6WJ88_9ACTN|nr:hypothetical protein [Actinoplanes sandaracinus]MDI6099740.1 hypothetical protein [Actinoplanes sandaracinus]
MGQYDGGGTSGNSWVASSVTEMFEMLQSHDSGPQRQMSAAWKKSYELLFTHLSQVREYRDNLAAAWPPEKNKAAAAYVDELNGLIASLEETYAAAVSNHRALATATDAIDEAREKLRTIQTDYAANQTALEKYQEQLRNRPVVAKGVAPVPQSPVADGRQAQLEQEARVVMASLSAELATAQTSFVAPKPYTPQWRINDGESFDPGGPGGVPSTMAPTFTPRPVNPAMNSRSNISRPGAKTSTASPIKGRLDQPISSKPSPSEGPILGGTKPIPGPPTTGLPITPTTITPSPTSPDPYTNLNNFSPTGGPSSSTALPRSPTTSNPSIGTFPPATGVRGGSVPHGGINGGVIGGTPPLGMPPSGRAGQSGPLSRGTQRVNPIGGMIGLDGVSRPGQRASSRSDEESQSRRWDPDNPWETEIGMDPVLLPSQEQRIDPGPTIGGR